jgi:hypothetical protein
MRAHTQDAEPLNVVPEAVQQIPTDERQPLISKSGWITESIALKTNFLKVRPAPTLNLNLSAAL